MTNCFWTSRPRTRRSRPGPQYLPRKSKNSSQSYFLLQFRNLLTRVSSTGLPVEKAILLEPGTQGPPISTTRGGGTPPPVEPSAAPSEATSLEPAWDPAAPMPMSDDVWGEYYRQFPKPTVIAKPEDRVGESDFLYVKHCNR